MRRVVQIKLSIEGAKGRDKNVGIWSRLGVLIRQINPARDCTSTRGDIEGSRVTLILFNYKRLAEHNCRKREVQKREVSENSGKTYTND